MNGKLKLTVVGSCVTRVKWKERRISILKAGGTAGNKSKRVSRPEYICCRINSVSYILGTFYLFRVYILNYFLKSMLDIHRKLVIFSYSSW